jgi:hypothetical protein
MTIEEFNLVVAYRKIVSAWHYLAVIGGPTDAMSILTNAEDEVLREVPSEAITPTYVEFREKSGEYHERLLGI